MRKKIILYSASIALAATGFGTWCALTGVSPFDWTATAKSTKHLTTMPGSYSTELNYEQRKDNGDLEYLFSAPRATPDPKHKGTLILEQPQVIIYMSDGRITLITADTGSVALDLAGDLTGRTDNPGKAFLRGGSLSKNVLLTMGPKETFLSHSRELQPGQLQATFDDDIKFNNSDRSLVSQGPLHVRGTLGTDTVWFDGANLTMTYNLEAKRFDYVRIDPMADGGKIVIKPGAAPAGSSPGTSPTASAPPTATPSQTAPAHIASAPATSAGPAVAATAPAPKATVYKVDFQDNVKAAQGVQSLTSDQLSLIFQMGTGDVLIPQPAPRNAATPTHVPAAVPASPLVQNSALPLMLAMTELPADAPPPAAPLAAKDDIVLTWSGPMEMRPIEGPSPLTSSKDRIVIATAQGDHAVLLHDGTTRAARAGKLSYQLANQHIILEPGTLPAVEMHDNAVGSMVCQSVDFLRSSGALALRGPGHADLLNNPSASTKPADQPAAKAPWLIQWAKSMDVTLLNRTDPNNPQKTTQVIRRAVLTGDAQVSDPTFLMRGQAIDLLLTAAENSKQPQALEHLLATGNVHVQSTKTPAATAPATQPAAPETDTIDCQRLEVQTAPGARGRLEPSELLADGDVLAMTSQPDKSDASKVVHQRIATTKLVAKLQPKPQSATAPAAAPDSLGGFALSELQASQGVKIQLEGYGAQPVLAVADSLYADPRTGQAKLSAPAADLDKSHFPRLQQGENEISGQVILLDQKTQSMEIPGAGQFVFQQTAPKAGEAPSPVKVTWADHMTYSGKDLLATLTGPVEAMLLGKPDQQSHLTARNMLVKLAPDKAGGPNSSKTKLAQITAEGDVQAEGASFDPAGKLLTRIFIRGPKLIYDDTTKALVVPAAGQLEAEDNRPEAAATKPAKVDNSPLAAAGNSKGQTAFAWKDSLTYLGTTGEIHLKKDVRMVHVPNQVPPPATNPAAPAPRSGRVDLQCQDLLATLTTSKTPAASPVALGLGGESRVTKVTAQGAAQVKSDNDILLADTLIYDALNNKAIAIGKDGNPAQGFRVEGPGFGSADRIEWDLGKGDSGIKMINPRGVITTPDSK